MVRFMSSSPRNFYFPRRKWRQGGVLQLHSACLRRTVQYAAFGWSYPEENWTHPNEPTVAISGSSFLGLLLRLQLTRSHHNFFQYVMRLLAMTVFGQGVPASVNKAHLVYFYALAPHSRCGRPN